MRRAAFRLVGVAALAWLSSGAQQVSPEKLEAHNVTVSAVTYRGKQATKVVAAGPDSLGDSSRFAILPGVSLKDGVIEAEVSGGVAPGFGKLYRGFVGFAFRMAGDTTHFECLYIRTKNGRSEDQLQRNHSTQYISPPEFPWQKLRASDPGKYESYVDLVPGEWTHLRIVVKGKTARLYVNGAEQPTLLVNDLKKPPAAGGVALWVGPGTVAHFAEVRVTPAP